MFVVSGEGVKGGNGIWVLSFCLLERAETMVECGEDKRDPRVVYVCWGWIGWL